VPFPGGYDAAKEIVVYVGFVNGEIRYTYRRSG
jgi:hypothetical protein